MNLINIGDVVKVHKTGAAAGCIGDGETVTVKNIQTYGDGMLYDGEYQNACGSADGIQFREDEYKVVKHIKN